MQNIESLPSNLYEIDNYTLSRMQGLPKGYLYSISQNTKFFQLLKSFSQQYLELYKQLDVTANSIQSITEQNIFLDDWLTTYGLPNIIFPNLTTTQSKVFAIQVMKTLKILNSVESYEAFFVLLGYEVKFYGFENIKDHMLIPYKIPILIGGTLPKNKIKYWVYVKESGSSLSNIPAPIPMPIYNQSNNTTKVKKVLDFIKPDFILIQYINEQFKNLFIS
jgi:hypothetical protein